MKDLELMTIEEHIEHLKDKFKFDSSGTAKAVIELIAAYNESKELTSLMKEYIQLMKEELDEVIPIAHHRGWRSTRYQQGEDLRRKIFMIEHGLGPEDMINDITYP